MQPRQCSARRPRSSAAWLPAAALALALSPGCRKSKEPADSTAGPTEQTSGSKRATGDETAQPAGRHDTDRGPVDAGARPDAAPAPLLPFDAPPPTTDWPGPYLTVTYSSAGIYSAPSLHRPLKIGYARNGGRVPVLPEKVSGEGCAEGWYRLAGDEAFICSQFGTTDEDSRRARLTTTAPDLDAILPYPYARNTKNGTPLYRSVPSAEQMKQYEPYLDPKSAKPDAGAPWWMLDNASLNSVQLEHLSAESDGVIERRMVKGFYVAVDRQFDWSGRTWYKTTKGMVGPQDRFLTVEGSPFHGVQLSDERHLPIAWTYGYRKSRPTYRIDEEAKKVEVAGSVPRLTQLALTGRRLEMDGRGYVETADGSWVRTAHVRIAGLPPLPDDLREDERWVDVNLDTQTLVALVGRRPVYATLVSSGRESKEKSKDHRTPTGQWRIREKHLTTTMDGDGTAAGDLPYSIEDVPYAMYFHGSYALHGAFWHGNYGARMSHGCVNLAPLDAKYLFFFTGPHPRAGWHGAWASNADPGSRIIIRDPTP